MIFQSTMRLMRNTSWILIFITCSTTVDSSAINFTNDAIDSEIPKHQILGGEDAKPGEIPYQVQQYIGGRRHCSGIILSRLWILTSGQCMRYLPDILAGTVNNTERRGANATFIRGERYFTHPEYNQTQRFIRNDIGLFKLSRQLNFSKTIQPLKLAEKGHIVTGKVQISGWGENEVEKKPEILQKTELDWMSDMDCQEAFKKKGYTIRHTNICAKDRHVKKACAGDLGGPMFDIETKVLVGVISTNNERCMDAALPTVAIEISHYTEWINHIMNNN